MTEAQAASTFIIILNWNKPYLTQRCIESVLRSDYTAYHIVVVDNGSGEKNYHILCDILKPYTVSVIRSVKNLGFSRGNNLGIKYALEQGAQYILLLNDDGWIDCQMISRMTNALLHHSDFGIVGPVIYYEDKPEKVWFAGYRYTRPFFLLRRGFFLSDHPPDLEEVDFINGCGMMIRREVIEQIGGLPEVYFMYYEDMEYCLHAQRAGWKLGCLKSAKMWHRVSESYGGKDSIKKEFQQIKSSLLFFRRNTNGVVYILNLIARVLQTVYKIGMVFINMGKR